ncbi:ATP synthase epsilon chain, sodium ion specific [Maioricimonas rarisocia]|uniref:ATP synthase epsilon chain n=1 Tax=Maioricimonas rarisocia TaxID=2528026 RepID=A0A517Z1D3_9PLAN|nr:ATP synthase F1 subunit epsilon [Maioricimonas rarisocia]QDU36278.1 ATP synthase epsilon chain, sodium ion specific [Maioricimonas rarisocia]
MIAATELRLVLVTPETTLFDESVRSVTFPLFDGQMGVLPGHTPMVGRLGAGELKFEGSGGSGSYFIDGGFAQIKGSVISILTHRATGAEEIDLDEAEKKLADVQQQIPIGDEAIETKLAELDRARRLRDIGRRRK